MERKTETAPKDVAIAAAMKALSHPRRVRIFRILNAAPEGLPYSSLLERAGLSIATLNHHLKLMRSAKLVATRRRGANVLYCLAPVALAPHLAWLSSELVADGSTGSVTGA